eukprot:6026139-Pleurochrysis_carterae.AAC.1
MHNAAFGGVATFDIYALLRGTTPKAVAAGCSFGTHAQFPDLYPRRMRTCGAFRAPLSNKFQTTYARMADIA